MIYESISAYFAANNTFTGLLVFLLGWFVASLLTRATLFTMGAILVYLESRRYNYAVTTGHLSKYMGSELDLFLMFLTWPVALPIAFISYTIQIANNLWKCVFTVSGSNIKLVPKWFSLEGLVKLMNPKDTK